MSLAFLFFYPLVINNHSLVRAATYTVTKTEDTNDGVCDADCSLREAIAAANANAGHDTIEFDIPDTDAGYVPASGDVHAYWEIESTSTLALSDEEGVFINGYSQTGASRNTAAFGETLNTKLTIALYVNANVDGMNFTGDKNRISGLAIRSAYPGRATFFFNSSNDNRIDGNFFGSDISGSTSSNYASFLFHNGSHRNTFGTNGDGNDDIGERNLIMGSNYNAGNKGTFLVSELFTGAPPSSEFVFAGNYVGVDKTGKQCAGGDRYRNHLYLYNGTGHQIGTNFDGVSDSEEANIFACITTEERGLVRLMKVSETTVQGNYIGTNPDFDALSGIFIRAGLVVRDADSSNVLIRKNVVAHNNGNGISIDFNQSSGITFRENRVFGNANLDIALLTAGDDRDTVTPNDPGDTDTGPNDLMNYPEIQGAEYLGNGKYKIWGWLEGNLAEAPFTIEVCKSSNHSSGYGGCLESLGTMTTSERMWSMEVTVSGDSKGSLSTFTALATNKNGSTSEFGPNFGGSIPGPGAPAPTPKKPDLLATHSGFTVKNDVISFAPPATFLWDVYLDVSHTPQTGTRRVSGAYWQASGIYNAWYKSFFNDAKIMPEVIATPYLLAIKYDPIKLDPNLPEGNLKLAYSQDGEVWKVLPNSVLDMVNKTVAVVTKQGGYYMLVSGYPF